MEVARSPLDNTTYGVNLQSVAVERPRAWRFEPFRSATGYQESSLPGLGMHKSQRIPSPVPSPEKWMSLRFW